jgi:shikimate dehydrogenase
MSPKQHLLLEPSQSSADTRVGLIGWPVAHSVSPAMHNAAFAALGLRWRYDLLPTSAEDVEGLLRDLETRGFRGVNVTLPHKQRVMSLLDEQADSARAIGAANTIVVRRGRLAGHNTDAGGFLAALAETGFDPTGKRALVLGAGGAARAVVYALARAGCGVLIQNRTYARAVDLARLMRRFGTGTLVSAIPEEAGLHRLQLEHIDLLVNATSVGMHPATDQSPWPEPLPLPSHWTVYDLVYNPLETRLLARAHSAGARPIGGLEMLIHQGALAFQLWTGEPAPLEVMRSAAHQALVSHLEP